ncbi:hypothetical protein ACFVZN_03995 [Streptomyces virginiae]|uniref:hypothetical protein n=1 Tax=Streptomyces virginiae TaxID=1961 RepID=UPI0036BDAE4E
MSTARAATAFPRLPGITFEQNRPQPADAMPRMDIAGFVGFATTGPLDVPVAIEDMAQFTEIFGGHVRLFRDASTGEQAYGHLAPTVDAFFAAGGRRCWVVRVAARDRPYAAVRARFPVPGLAVVGEDGFPVQALLPARSAGSWADDVRVSGGVLAERLRLVSITYAGAGRPPVHCVLDGHAPVRIGDLIRVTYLRSVPRPVRATGMFAVTGLAESAGSPCRTEVTGARPLWLRAATLGQCVAGTMQLPPGPVPVTVEDAGAPGEVLVRADMPLENAPAAGTLLRLVLDGFGTAVLLVRESRAAVGVGSQVRVSGSMHFVTGIPPVAARRNATPDATEVLGIELRALTGGDRIDVVGNLGPAPGHPRWIGELPTDEELYGAALSGLDRAGPVAVPQLWQETTKRRFPLAGTGSPAEVFYPIAVDTAMFAGAEPQPGRRLERDGLADFGAGLFLDPGLADSGTSTLMSTADYLSATREPPQQLLGVHALLALDEVTVVAVPDAVHQGWRHAAPPEPPQPPPHVPYLPPSECRHTGTGGGDFQDRSDVTPGTPVFAPASVDSLGNVHLSWNGVSGEHAVYVLQESADLASWEHVAEIHRGTRTTADLYGRAPGTYAYRVRAEAGGAAGDWSDGIAVAVTAGEPWVPQAPAVDNHLPAVHRALVRMCAARGDQFAVLALPVHHREADAVTHATALRRSLAGEGERVLGFGALYHPWPVMAVNGAEPLPQPPDGTAAGTLAARALGAGSWVAPANLPLGRVLALTPRIPAQAHGPLEDGRVNTLRATPRGFMVLSAATLSADPQFRQINVRRLLSLLRRIALREGPAYVFEPDGPAARSALRRRFEAVLSELLVRGAFAGSTRADSFQVTTPTSPAGEGRLLVELRVAPSVPLRFLLVRLLRSGEGDLSVEGV